MERLRAVQARAQAEACRKEDAKAWENAASSAEHARRLSADPQCRGTLNAAQLLDVRVNSAACALRGGRGATSQWSVDKKAWHEYSCAVCPQGDPIYGLRYHCAESGDDLCEACWRNLPDTEFQEMYTLAARHPLLGSWPWDEPGKLKNSRRMVTPYVAKVNRAWLKYQIFAGSSGSGMSGPRLDTLYWSCNRHTTIAATGEQLRAESGYCTSEADAEEEALRRLLEVDGCKLLQMIDERDAQETAGGGGDGDGGAAFATSAMRRLHEMAKHLSFDNGDGLTRLICAPDSEGSSPVVEYSSVKETADDGKPLYRVSATLSECKGKPSITGAAAATSRTAEHSAAESACAFVVRVVETLSDSSYTFGAAQLQQLLRDLRTGDSGAAQGLFKELLHVVAMRLKRSLTWKGRSEDKDAYLRFLKRSVSWVGRSEGSATYIRYELMPPLPLKEPLEQASVTLLQVNGEPTFYGEPAAGREAAEQSAAEAALIFICAQVPDCMDRGTESESPLYMLWPRPVAVRSCVDLYRA